MSSGKIYMIPIPIAENAIQASIPMEVQKQTTELRYFIVENIKTARRYLRQIDKNFPIDDSTFFILDKRTPPEKFQKYLEVVLDGNNCGVMSEAGCPGVADPGAQIVKLAQEKNIQVIPLVGPSSILLALMASGFDGQQFTFHGYAPYDKKELKSFLNRIASQTKFGTQIFMDTPYRNQKLLDACLENLNDNDLLCVALNINGSDEMIKTQTVKNWKKNHFQFKEKQPAMFLIGR